MYIHFKCVCEMIKTHSQRIHVFKVNENQTASNIKIGYWPNLVLDSYMSQVNVQTTIWRCLQKKCFQNLAKFTRKHLLRSFYLNHVECLLKRNCDAGQVLLVKSFHKRYFADFFPLRATAPNNKSIR